MAIHTSIPAAPAGHATVNPFIVTDDVDGLMGFLKEVFGATERPEARTVDADGLLIHAELAIGDTTVMFAERKPDWPFIPSLLQVYVDDVEAALDTVRKLGATVVTEPTGFFGDTFSRFLDPWSNLWWVWRHGGADVTDEAKGEWTEGGTAGDEAWDYASPELTYIHDTILAAMQRIRDPRLGGR